MLNNAKIFPIIYSVGGQVSAPVAATLSSIDSVLPYLDKGGATFAAACIAGAISVISLIFNVFSARSQAQLVSGLSDAITVKKEAREYKLKQLTLFYDPIYTLLAANKNIFERIGPSSKVRFDVKFSSEETAEVWKKLSTNVINPNNLRICEIIEKNLHYMTQSDRQDLYLDFVTHAHAYKVFKENAYEAYSLFQYPKKFFESVRDCRDEVKTGLLLTYTEQ